MKATLEQISLKEILKGKTKEALKNLTYRYPIKGKSKLKKEELANALYEIMTNKDVMRENAIVLAEKFNELDEKKDKNDMSKIRKFIELGYGKMSIKDEEVEIILAYEINDISSNIDKDLTQEVLRYSLIKTYLLACVRLYGVIEIDFFIRLFNEQNSEENPLNYEELEIHLNRCKKMNLEPKKYENCIVSGSLFMVQGEIEKLMSQRENKDFYVPSKEELLKYEDEFYIEETSQYMEFDKFIHNKVKNKEMAEGLVEDLSYVLRFESINIKYAIDQFNRRKVPFDSKKEIERFIKVYVDLANNTRSWANRGYTANELSNEEELTTLDKVDAEINDLCSCGSGKK